ncbi:hypothetical protein KVR01_000481 [Diaporthe batatas]|uniref:uncharacterized protein n=1 Tax=Diaporthe batatas TaxID=748121 RepID=UPI001D03AEAC|nr:uncharacterized protein KVR01_000481 [Diaporthe batatas]KAG8169736.1 hypothetical protein KVR01_000481 [Diaporthe batatas]
MYVVQVLEYISSIFSTLFILSLPFRISRLYGKTPKLVAQNRGQIKLTLAVALAAVQGILLNTIPAASQSATRIFGAITSLAACVGLFPLLLFEHRRSIRPSDLAIIYLLVTLSCDTLLFYTEVLTDSSFHNVHLPPLSSWPSSLNICIKFALLVLESQGKKHGLRDTGRQHSPEEMAGVLSRVFFWWINPILAQGRCEILTGDTLPPVDHRLSSKTIRKKALLAWDQRKKPSNRATLPKVLVASMLPDFLAPILPRLLLIAFRYSQPILISTVIRYVNTPLEEKSSNTGYAVILMAVVTYLGLAISKGMYQHRLNRLQVMIRGAVVGLINNKSLSHPSADYEDGRAVTLISTDAENVCQSARFFHETWAQVIEVILGTAMLAREVGWLFPVPLVIIFFCSRMSRYLAKNLQSMQKSWSVATQDRLAMTSSMLATIKSLKMLGTTSYTETLIQNLRLRELAMAKKVRWMMVAYNASANALGIFSPIITFVLYALLATFRGLVLDTETAFTTTALLGLITHPANMIMSIVPQAVGSLAAFERIQQYLLQPPRRDDRLMVKKTDSISNQDSLAIKMENVTFMANPPNHPILKDVNLSVSKGSIVICSGPVGSGKTVLAKGLMGEIPTANGKISVSSKRIGLCAQSPWLPSGTLGEAIRGFSSNDTIWYEEVLKICCLQDDISTFPHGEDTQIGSRGFNLSGGQRQRVALARALYARCEILVLDDPFSALDNDTQRSIVENLLGANGLFKTIGTTVLLITNNTSYFHLSDWLTVLGDASIKFQGTWADLAEKLGPTAGPVVPQENNHQAQLEVDSTIQKQALKVADAASDLSRATGDLSLYSYYIRAVGYRNFFLLMICTALYSLFITFPQYWLTKWTAAPAYQTTFYVGGYLIASLIAWTATTGSMWSTHILIASDSGVALHRRLLSTVIRAPLSFFSATESGTTLNRFSQDIQLVDKQLPPAMLSLLNQVFKLLVQVSLLLTAQKFLSLSLPACVIVVYLVQKVYLRTSRQLRLLEIESQAAVYSSFLESNEGISTIRSFGWEKQIEDENILYLDRSQQPSYVLVCLQRWLNIVLDLIISGIAIGFIVLVVTLKGTTTAGQVGMALNIVLLTNATLLGLVESWTNLEISLGAISRLKHLEAETPKEDKPHENQIPDGIWPSAGSVEIDDVTVEYTPDAVALRNITMGIPAGQHVIVCGRTGSGKSTLILTLLRLLDTSSGVVKVDGLDLSIIPRTLVRQQCFVTVAQDSFVLAQASLRFNLDPSDSLTDESITATLRRVSLWQHFASGSHRKDSQVLKTPMESLPPISTGQSQLLALCRAILHCQMLRNLSANARPRSTQAKPILLLDEATSSLDPDTESVMRRIIHEEFTSKGHTIIAITHRLTGMAEYMRPGQDAVVSLSQGRINKFIDAEDILI